MIYNLISSNQLHHFISFFFFAKLRNELKGLGLSGSGTKKELTDRYNAYWEEKKNETVSSISNQTIPETTVVNESELPTSVPTTDLTEQPIETGNI